MTYKQLGYWDNMRGRTSMAILLKAAEETQFEQRYREGWTRANAEAKAKNNRDWRPLNGEKPVDTAAN